MPSEFHSARPLIAALLVRAGALMEDASPTMISQLPSTDDEMLERIGQLADLAGDLQIYAAAAEALALRSPDL